MWSDVGLLVDTGTIKSIRCATMLTTKNSYEDYSGVTCRSQWVSSHTEECSKILSAIDKPRFQSNASPEGTHFFVYGASKVWEWRAGRLNFREVNRLCARMALAPPAAPNRCGSFCIRSLMNALNF